MFRKRIIFVKIDTTGLDADGAKKLAEDVLRRIQPTGISGWWFNLWNMLLVMPSYEGDTSDIKVLR